MRCGRCWEWVRFVAYHCRKQGQGLVSRSATCQHDYTDSTNHMLRRYCAHDGQTGPNKEEMQTFIQPWDCTSTQTQKSIQKSTVGATTLALCGHKMIRAGVKISSCTSTVTMETKAPDLVWFYGPKTWRATSPTTSRCFSTDVCATFRCHRNLSNANMWMKFHQRLKNMEIKR
ncbi:hypothetical protein ILYODFUR_011021 [Ilyodon furcidens]|uniref:Uncharacterized protein n=1 Tax=Ilyodon furcidens TaxID=33524 RepID=A0ABV0V237_9TELE